MSLDPPAPVAARRRQPPVALYPALLGAIFVVELLIASGVSPFSAVRTLVVTVLLALALAAIGTVLLRDRHRGGVIAGLWVLALMAGDDPRLLLVAAAAGALLAVERYAIPASRLRIRWPLIGSAFQRLTMFVALVVGVQVVLTGAFWEIARAVTHETALRPGHPLAPASSSDPDIYVLLLDGHTRADVLSSVFGRDGEALTSGLESHALAVVPQSRSNYTQTAQSLPSLLEGRQIDDIERMAGLVDGTERRTTAAVVREVVNENATTVFLRDRGYEVDSVSAGYEEVAMREADRFVDTGQLNEFEIAMLRRSIVGDLVQAIAPDFVSAQQRGRILDDLDQLATAPSWIGAGPQFVFVHVPSPHPPWVFEADGSPRTVPFDERWFSDSPASTGLTLDDLVEAYGGQAQFVDEQVDAMLDSLDAAIAHRGRPAAVILLSDHGSWVGVEGGHTLLRFKNLIAARLPDGPADLPANITLVDTLPTLFHQLFGIPVVDQPDTQYRAGNGGEWDFVPVPDPEAGPSP